VTWIPQSKCTALALSPCNGDKHVIMQRIVIGNSSLRASNLGTPTGMDSQGLVPNYMTAAGAVARFPYMQLDEGQEAYVSECQFKGVFGRSVIYSRAIF
jgi:hypothetical protein